MKTPAVDVCKADARILTRIRKAYQLWQRATTAGERSAAASAIARLQAELSPEYWAPAVEESPASIPETSVPVGAVRMKRSAAGPPPIAATPADRTGTLGDALERLALAGIRRAIRELEGGRR